MVRAAVLSIVLTLVIGPNAGALCSVWCHPEQAATSSCPHQDATTSPGVTREDSCPILPPARPRLYARNPKTSTWQSSKAPARAFVRWS